VVAEVTAATPAAKVSVEPAVKEAVRAIESTPPVSTSMPLGVAQSQPVVTPSAGPRSIDEEMDAIFGAVQTPAPGVPTPSTSSQAVAEDWFKDALAKGILETSGPWVSFDGNNIERGFDKAKAKIEANPEMLADIKALL